MSSLQSPEERPCVEVTPGEARYLLTIFDIARAGVRISQASLARRLGVSGPTALEMVRRLRQLGLIAEQGLELTSAGTSAALGLGSRRHAARVLALDVLGLDERDADAEARRLAPAVSSTLAKYLLRWRDSHKTAG
jgi:Mn-dependent DtxR family transcriptional regulator